MAVKEQAAQNELAFNDLIKKADVVIRRKTFRMQKSDYNQH